MLVEKVGGSEDRNLFSLGWLFNFLIDWLIDLLIYFILVDLKDVYTARVSHREVDIFARN